MSMYLGSDGTKGLHNYIDTFNKINEKDPTTRLMLTSVAIRMQKGDFSDLTSFKAPKNEAAASEIKNSLKSYESTLSDAGITIPENVKVEINKKLGKFAEPTKATESKYKPLPDDGTGFTAYNTKDGFPKVKIGDHIELSQIHSKAHRSVSSGIVHEISPSGKTVRLKDPYSDYVTEWKNIKKDFNTIGFAKD